MNRAMTMLAMLAVVFALAGCGGSKVDTTTPVEQLKTQAQAMDTAAIQKMVDSYKAALAAKEGELQKLADKIKAIPVTQLLGDEAKKLKADSDQIQTAVKDISERLQVYVDALKAKAPAAK